MRHLLIAFTVLFATNVAFAEEPSDKKPKEVWYGNSGSNISKPKPISKEQRQLNRRATEVVISSTVGLVAPPVVAAGVILGVGLAETAQTAKEDREAKALETERRKTEQAIRELERTPRLKRPKILSRPKPRPKPKRTVKRKSRPKRSKSRQRPEIDRSHLHEIRRHIDDMRHQVDRMDHNDFDRQQQAFDRKNTG
jgi:cell division protein FtsB